MPDVPNMDDANLALRLYELRREPELRKARKMVGDLLDGASWETVQAVRQYAHKENAHFRQVTSYWEMVCSFVNRGIFHPDVFLDTCGEALYTFTALEPHIAKIRESAPRFLVQTETVIADHPAVKERVDSIRAMRAQWAAQAAAAAAAKKPAKKPAKKK
ncbi:MAG: hypothetical protein U1E39_12920 [Planctomycetota bacterium]